MSNLQLTQDQQNAYSEICKFIIDPDQKRYVLAGDPGTGKTVLIKYVLDQLPVLIKSTRLLDPDWQIPIIKVTATTNPAAEVLAVVLNSQVPTIHSLLGLRVETNYKTDTTRLVSSTKRRTFASISPKSIIVIDEASNVTKELLRYIEKMLGDFKVLYVGDPNQTIHHSLDEAPVFGMGYSTSVLKEIVRVRKINGEIHPIEKITRNCIRLVEDNIKFSIIPDNVHVIHTSRDDFEDRMLRDFGNPNWQYNDSKLLAWTNNRVINYNAAITAALKGSPDFVAGDRAISNTYVRNEYCDLKNNEQVLITKVTPMNHAVAFTPNHHYAIAGKKYTLNHIYTGFMPDIFAKKSYVINQLRKNHEYNQIENIEKTWLDLRAVYGSTVNKAQGATYKRVYIDLDDIGNCPNHNQLARMLNVAVSRASEQIIFTGDIKL